MDKIRRVMAVGMLGTALGLGAGGAIGCSSLQQRGASTWNLQPSPTLVAAKGKVVVGPLKEGGNRQVWVEAQHLAPPERAFGKQTYVVWVVPREGGEPQNMGALVPNQDLNANLTFNTAFRNFDVVVTAEEQSNATSPSDDRAFQVAVTAPA